MVLQANTDSTIRVVAAGTAAKTSVSVVLLSLALAFAKVSAISACFELQEVSQLIIPT
jgi:hypothetical protein